MELRQDQVDAALAIARAGRCIFRGRRGYGKTAVVCDLVQNERSLVVTPNLGGAGPRQWHRQAELWAPGMRVNLYTGTPTQRAKAIGNWRYAGGMLVTNYELMQRDLETLADETFRVLVFDEAHRLKNRQGKWFKAAKQLAKRSPFVWHVTGTPVVNKAADVWPLLHMIDPRRFSSYWRWVNEHCIVEERHFKQSRFPVKIVGDLKPGHEEIVRAELAGLIVDPPMPPAAHGEPVTTVLEVEMTPEERRAYRDLEEQYFAVGPDGEYVVAPNEVSKLTRLRQVTSEWSSAFQGAASGSKVKATADMLWDFDEPVVVMCAFQATCDALVRELGEADAITYHGGLTAYERSCKLERFLDGEVQYIVGTLATMGEALDGLQTRAAQLVLVDRPWSPAGYEQAVGRLDRTGQTRQVVVTHVTAADSADQRVAEALASKQELLQALGLASQPA